MSNATQATEKAAARLATRSLAELLNDWDAADVTLDPQNMPTVRGWIMDEMERRNPEAFDAWMMADGGPSPRDFFAA